jgi:hypothetical protein
MSETKTCNVCKETKQVSEFYPTYKKEGQLRASCKECTKLGTSAYQRQKKFGLSPSDFSEMVMKQNGACAICGCTDTGSKRTASLNIDHCHETGEVRGLLCHSCNLVLGHAKDNTEVLQRAIDYINSHNSTEGMV